MRIYSHLISLKIDVDTYRGMEKGVPVLLDILRSHDIKASFFLSFGPDNSGKAIWNIFRKKGFLSKMVRTGAPRLYGLKTMLYGTLLSAPLIASAFPDLTRQIAEEGHEIGIHAWDHRLWQDNLDKLSERKISEEFEKSFSSFKNILGITPKATAAPAWSCNSRSLKIQDSLGLDYSSDTRGVLPFYPRCNGQVFKTLQIPTNQPCIEELIGLDFVNSDNLVEYQVSLLKQYIQNVITIHAEVEGGIYKEQFDQFVRKTICKGYRFCPLNSIAADFHGAPARSLEHGHLPGRSGRVAISS
ncbi:MAG: polysaccharide deacetylase family protein [Candidatus Scalindua sp.]|nr:polysaccharide deacetylase family protein [Candidatus Scalindua sp.]